MTNNQSDDLLQVKNLSVAYVNDEVENRAVRNLTFHIKQGEIYGLVGESGCGKSTVAMSIVNYLPQGSKIDGEIFFYKEDILKMKEKRLRSLRGNRIGMVYQDPLSALNPSMTIMSQMEEVLLLHGSMTRGEARERCYEVLELVKIADPRDVSRRYPHQLSGGMQQRVIIAMALLLHPALLIMDEPTTGLDVTIEAAVLDLVNELKEKFSTAILFISHNLGVIARLCNRIGVMYAGEMVEEASVADLYREQKHPYSFGLLSCIPRKGKSKKDNPLWSIPGRVPSLNELPNHCVYADRCGMAQERCREETPDLFLVDKVSQRSSRCFYWQDVQGESLRTTDTTPVRLDFIKEKQRVSDLKIEKLRVQFNVTGGIFSLKLSKDKVKALDGITLEVPSCSTVGIVGESGCGKSTLARAVAGLVPVTNGSIRMGDQDLTKPVENRQKKALQLLQMVFQNPDSTLNPQKTVEAELRRPLRLFRMASHKEEDTMISQLLTAVNLDDSYRTRYPSQLSGGEKQRVAIARAFAGCPQLVLCDEPTSSLDVSVQSTVLNLLQRLQRDVGVSLVFISHDLGVVRYISDYIGVVYLGRLCEFGTVAEVFEPPYHPYTEALLSAIPVPDPSVRKTRISLEGNVPSSINPPVGCAFHTRCPRKLGEICETTVPETKIVGGHRVYCHIPPDELVQKQASFT